MTKPFLLIAALAMLVSPTGARAFYDASAESHQHTKDLKADYGATGRSAEDASVKLQKAIDDVAEAGGGFVRIPPGEYSLAGIVLKSNVHLEIASDVVITPYLKGAKKSVAIFNLGRDGRRLENVSIAGTGGRFTVQLSPHAPGIVVFSFGNVRNFSVSNVTIHDCLTKFASFQFVPTGQSAADLGRPKSGTIRDASVTGAAYGYGLVQIQAAESVLFENLSGQGGVTLRVETGAASMNDSQLGGVDNIVGRNIACTDGNATVMISPHSMRNGVIMIDGVKATNCGFAVRVDGGFVAKKYSNPDIAAGTFARGSYVKNIEATFGMTAQLKPKHYKYMPAALVKSIGTKSENGGASFRGPSIVAVLNDANYEVLVENVSAHGFTFQQPVIHESDVTGPARPKKKAN